jgi:hypothetical protein
MDATSFAMIAFAFGVNRMNNQVTHRAPTPALMAGTAYFAMVFALGFLLGTVRTLFVADAPSGGRLLGVLIELPIMLIASWILCRFAIRRFGVPTTLGARALMGGLAFVLLLLAELMVGALLFDRSVDEHVALYTEASYALGLAAQFGFALMPSIQLWRHPAS